MSKIGEFLKKLRTEKHLTIEEVAATTGIRTQYLEALENGEYEKIPGDVFIKGFIRNYGNCLGADGNALVEEYKQSVKAAKASSSGNAVEDEILETGSPSDDEVQAAVDAVVNRNKQRTKPKASFVQGIKNAFGDIKSFIYDNLYETVEEDDDLEDSSEETEEAKPAAFVPTAASAEEIVPKAPVFEPKAEPVVPKAKPVAAKVDPQPSLFDSQDEDMEKTKFVPVYTAKKTASPEAAPQEEYTPEETPARSKKTSGGSSFFNFKIFAGVFALLLLVFFGVMAYFMFSGRGPANSPNVTAKVGSGVKSPHSSEAVKEEKDAANAKDGDAAKAAAEKAETKDKDAKDTKDAKTEKSDVKAADSKDDSKKDAKTDSKTDTAASEAVSKGSGDGLVVEITYKEPVWTQVTADGKGLEAAVIPKGATRVYKGDKEVKVNLGAIRNVVIKVNGKEVPYGEKEWGEGTKVFRK